MPTELEQKLRVSNHGPTRDRLRAAGAAYIGRVLETNHIFDHADGSLLAAGQGLRVRAIDPLDGTTPPPTLTYKGPKQPGPFKQREEIEIQIDNPDRAIAILHALGFTERVIFQKRRETWHWSDCSIELDELPELGHFVEIEGPDEPTIRRTIEHLDLTRAEPIPETYVKLTANAPAATSSPGVTALRFKPP